MTANRWRETLGALACLVLWLASPTRAASAVVLLCLLPGISICRHWIGVRGAVRLFVLGSLFSLAALPAVTIPLALLAGRSTPLLALGSAAAFTILPALLPRRQTGEEQPAIDWRPFAAISAGALAMQAWMTSRIYPSAETIHWKGLPDLTFFHGIYTQIGLAIPPMDPENGSSLLVHNWLYHFHFVQIGQAGGLSIEMAQRLASGWMALVLFGLMYMLGAELFRSRLAGVLACLFTATSGEIYWLVRSLVRGELMMDPMPWKWTSMGITVLVGWYNLPALAAALGAWYCFEKARARGESGWLGGSLALCCALAFFHPIFYGVFMTAFCLWIAALSLRTGLRPSWGLYLATPLPFFLAYKLPYYGWSLPPPVMHPDFSWAGILERGQDLFLITGILLAAGLPGLLRIRHGFPRTLVALCTALTLLVAAPNPHWFKDLLLLALALAAGSALSAIRGPLVRATAIAAALVLSTTAFTLHARQALSEGHTFSSHEIEAAAWLESHSRPDELVAVLPNGSSTFTVIGRAGRRVVHGFTGHLTDFHHDALVQALDVARIFTSTDSGEAEAIARRQGAALVYIGPVERRVMPPERMPAPFRQLVFASGPVELYRIDQPDVDPAQTKKAPPRKGAFSCVEGSDGIRKRSPASS
jgi:hypothetical protein